MKQLSWKNLLIGIILIWGIGIWVLDYLPSIIFEKEEFRFVITRHFFYYLQILITTTGFLLLHTAITGKLDWKKTLIYFLLSTILVQTRTFHNLHDLFRTYNIYLDIFKTNIDGTQVPSFQYSRILLIAIICFFAAGSFLFIKRNMLKVFLIFFIAAFYIFFYFMHLYIGRQAYMQYESQLQHQIEMILDNSENYSPLCKEFSYQCDVIERGQDYTLSKPQLKNRIISSIDTTDEANALITKYLIEFEKSNKVEAVFMESAIVTDNLRAVVFGFKKINDKEVLVLVDYDQLSYALDLYLIYFMIIMNIFMLVWLYGVIWLYKKHQKFPDSKELKLVENTP